MQRTKGFSLIEMAVVLVIIMLLLGSALVPLSTQFEQRKITETEKALDEIKEALLGYAVSHNANDGKPYLPCPDTDNDGVEQPRVGGACPPQSQEGRLPWVTLGVTRVDSWGNLMRYRVHPNFSSSNAGFTLSSTANLQVCTAVSCAVMLANNVPAVILSHGRNGFGARSGTTGDLNPAATSADELANSDGRNPADTADTANVIFVSRTITPLGTAAGEFDDLVVWLSPNVLLNRLVAAGKLP